MQARMYWRELTQESGPYAALVAQRNQQELGGFFIESVLGLNENQGIKSPPFLF